jgi:hypothetical protein
MIVKEVNVCVASFGDRASQAPGLRSHDLKDIFAQQDCPRNVHECTAVVARREGQGEPGAGNCFELRGAGNDVNLLGTSLVRSWYRDVRVACLNEVAHLEVL